MHPAILNHILHSTEHMYEPPTEPLPTLGRMMVFIDGENLVNRFQAMRDAGREPNDGIQYQKDVFVWSHGSIQSQLNIVLRATYYTYCFGDQKHSFETAAAIKSLDFPQYRPMRSVGGARLPNNLYPRVFNKPKNRRGKGVDIQLTVDALLNTYQNNLDAVYLISGDGDYEPLILECQRQGKQVYIAALSSGLNPKLPIIADTFINLGAHYFKDPPSATNAA